MHKAPVSFTLAKTLIVVSIFGGFYGLVDVEMSFRASLVVLAIQGFLVLILVCLFTQPNLGRLLSGAVFTTIGLMAAVATVREVVAGFSISLIVIDITLATVHLTLAWYLLVGARARDFATRRHLNARS